MLYRAFFARFFFIDMFLFWQLFLTVSSTILSHKNPEKTELWTIFILKKVEIKFAVWISSDDWHKWIAFVI